MRMAKDVEEELLGDGEIPRRTIMKGRLWGTSKDGGGSTINFKPNPGLNSAQKDSGQSIQWSKNMGTTEGSSSKTHDPANGGSFGVISDEKQNMLKRKNLSLEDKAIAAACRGWKNKEIADDN
ncbi:phosphohydrolase [Sesbania bispinosa]|nr:phosphohydrolase [Sesbania bispinosa]